MDVENRFMLTVSQRWLGIRLDFLGTIIVYYAEEIEQEAAHELPDKKPPSPWPSQGHVKFDNMVLKYCPELPPVLKGISMDVRGGEKIGIAGQTGAGKSSLMSAIYRLIELDSGAISIDGVDIANVGLSDLRSGLSIIPQDTLLFSGTLRTNLDPFNLHDDAKLWDALKRSYLVDNTKRASVLTSSSEMGGHSGSNTPVNRFTLNSVIEDEGGNLSIGQRSLVSLARALVLILDKATAHRSQTIIDTPANLYQVTNGIFRSMCERSSITQDNIRIATKIREDNDAI
ncbi:P-loop containing nucleoside triphosphate hydrolase protein [Lentinula raphanica]|nr:P-loop containing nucleoside triphosphate hydrolase protein [Lentinula raphanica]